LKELSAIKTEKSTLFGREVIFIYYETSCIPIKIKFIFNPEELKFNGDCSIPLTVYSKTTLKTIKDTWTGASKPPINPGRSWTDFPATLLIFQPYIKFKKMKIVNLHFLKSETLKKKKKKKTVLLGKYSLKKRIICKALIFMKKKTSNIEA